MKDRFIQMELGAIQVRGSTCIHCCCNRVIEDRLSPSTITLFAPQNKTDRRIDTGVFTPLNTKTMILIGVDVDVDVDGDVNADRQIEAVHCNNTLHNVKAMIMTSAK